MSSSTRRRSFLAPAVIAISAVLVASCAAGSEGAAPAAGRTVEIIVPNFPELIDGLQTTLNEDFEKRTGIDVQVVNVGGDTSYTGVNQRIQNDLIAGRMPDLAITGLNNVRAYADSQSAVPLDDVMKNDAEFAVGDLAPNLLSLGQFDGSTYGMTYGVSTYMLYYNADIFRAAGLDPDKPPTTFSELRSAAAAIVASKAATNGVIIRSDHVAGLGYQNFLGSLGGSFMNADESEIAFNSSAGASIVSFWRDLHRDGLGRAVTVDQSRDIFERGDTGMLFQSSSYNASVASTVEFDVRSVAYPIPDGGTRRAVVGGAALVAFNPDAEKLADEWTVIRTLVSAEGVTDLVRATGYSPVNTKATGPDYLGDYVAANPLSAASWGQLAYLAPWYQFPGSKNSEINKAMQDHVTAAMAGNEEPQAALDAAAQQARDLLP